MNNTSHGVQTINVDNMLMNIMEIYSQINKIVVEVHLC